jgi:hypothetical protein
MFPFPHCHSLIGLFLRLLPVTEDLQSGYVEPRFLAYVLFAKEKKKYNGAYDIALFRRESSVPSASLSELSEAQCYSAGLSAYSQM